MGLLGISLILASVVLFCLRPPAWLPAYVREWRHRPQLEPTPPDTGTDGGQQKRSAEEARAPPNGKAERDRLAMPPPPISLAPSRQPQALQPPSTAMSIPIITQDSADAMQEEQEEQQQEEEEPATPKAPRFSMDDSAHPALNRQATAVPALLPPLTNPPAFVKPPPPPANRAAPSASSLMPPPPRPNRIPTLAPLSSSSSLSSSLSPYPNGRLNPLPSRPVAASASAPGTSTLAPPPTHSSKPTKPRQKVTLTPGHSPLDWARLASDPTADLTGLGGRYIRVTPTLLRAQTGRRGKPAWMALGGRVYNVSPYLPFHPGGEPELLRGAGRDGTKLFGEIHPWVNYEGMLAGCLVGILVSEEEAAVPDGEGKMDEMD